MKNKKVELLAPAGSFESLLTAVDAGCDAVYIGIGEFNMRASAAVNFAVEDLQKIKRICEKDKVKLYVTINSLVYDNEIPLMEKIVDTVSNIQIDGIIAADLATIMYSKKKNVAVHISTQMSVSNIESVKFFSKYADRIVLARELSLDQIKHICSEIKKQNIKGPSGRLLEIEVFVHGALCVAVSGRCSMSLYCYDRSANRGKCTHICRRSYKVTDLETGQELKIDNHHVMSSSDLSTIGMLDKIIEAGVSVLKIEGRGRTPDYVYTTVKTYKDAINSINTNTFTKSKIEKWNKDLGTVYNRGFTQGFYMGRKFSEWANSEGSQATKKRVQIGRIKNYYDQKKIALIKLDADEVIKVNDEYNITGPTSGLVAGKIQKIQVNDKQVAQAKQGDLVTIRINKKVRKNDKFFLIKSNTHIRQ
ncbi:U32 family peptidase [Candidatus Dojkabacteria bacterium]|nr:U32 family peptidase [Candidatus Dojkabacteria bacterium]